MSDSIKDVSKLKVADLKRELKSRNLSTVGNKQELQDRLQMSLQDGTDSSLLLDDTGTVDTEDILNEDDVLADGDDSDAGHTPATPDEGNSSLKRHLDDELDEETVSSTPVAKSSEAESNGPPAKKVTLNRKIAIPQNSSLNESSVTEESQSKPEIIDEDKKVVKLSAITMKERLELRAAKFGAPVPDAVKKEARAARFGSTSVTAPNSVPEVSVDLLKKRAERFGIQPGSKVEQVELEERKKKRLERFGVSDTPSNGSGNQVKIATTTATLTATKPGRIPITAPSGSSSVNNKSMEDKKKMRAERFKSSTPITTK